jgi:hypothetical protein
MKYRLLTQAGWPTYKVNQVYNIVDDPDLLRHVERYPNDWELVPESELPEKWYCLVTKENQQMLNEWRESVASTHRDYMVPIGDKIVSKHEWDGSYYYTGVIDNDSYGLHQELTTEQFNKLVYKPKFGKLFNFGTKTEKMKTLIPITDVIKIHGVACSTWKSKIANYLAKVDSNQNIQFTPSEVNEMFNAATSSQLPLLESIFGKRSQPIDWDKIRTGSRVMIQHTVEHCDGFYKIDLSEPVDVVFFKTKYFIDNNNTFKTEGAHTSYVTFHQNGKFVLFSSERGTNYIVEVVEY